ncbi:MAG: hypothetical protein ACRC6V_09515 [Bacteroidales bacterium]
MNKFKAAYIILFLVLMTAIFSGASQLIIQAETTKDKAISKEFVSCLSAICIDKSPGQQCLELNANIAHIYVTEDAHVIEAKRIIIETSNKKCGTSIFK